MSRVLARELRDNIGKKIQVQGWLHKKRLLGGLTFINVRDRSGLTQAVIQDKDEVEKLRGLQIGTVLKVTGTVKEEPRAPGGAEIHQPALDVLVPVTDEPPIEIDKPLSHKSENLETLFENRVVGLRNLQEQTIFRVQAQILEAARSHFKSHDFTEMNTPKLLAEATEGGAEVFKLDYFGKTATLAQSAQFYKQMMVGVFERVFETNPTYRAELSSTTRHMTEYITIDAEMGFIELADLLEFTGGMLRYIAEQVWQVCGEELKKWNTRPPLLSESIPRISMREIHERYSQANSVDTTGEEDLRPDEERWICEYAKKNLGSEAVFVTQWPVSGMKFYHRKNVDNPEFADRSDLLFRGVEIATLSMREHRYDVLVQQLKDVAHSDPNHPGFKFYLQAFQYGLPPHGGFGLGLERFTEKLIGLANIKEAALFPRDINRLAP
jgi:nondiscriminating aspartyl-tRNA synthetase